MLLLLNYKVDLFHHNFLAADHHKVWHNHLRQILLTRYAWGLGRYSPILLVVPVFLLRLLLVAHPEHLQRVRTSWPHLCWWCSSHKCCRTKINSCWTNAVYSTLQSSPVFFLLGSVKKSHFEDIVPLFLSHHFEADFHIIHRHFRFRYKIRDLTTSSQVYLWALLSSWAKNTTHLWEGIASDGGSELPR